MALDHLARVGVDGPCALRAATLHRGHVDGTAEIGTTRSVEGDEHDDDHRENSRATGHTERAARPGAPHEQGADLPRDPREQHDTTDASDVVEWAGDLRDAEGGERNTTEGERKTQRLHQSVGGGKSHDSQVAIDRSGHG